MFGGHEETIPFGFGGSIIDPQCHSVQCWCNKNFSSVLKSGLINEMVTAWWVVYPPIHIIWMMSDTMNMFGGHEETIPFGFGGSIIDPQCHLVQCWCNKYFSSVLKSLAGNVGVVSGISPPQKRPTCRHDIAPCRLAGRRVGVVSACVNCDMSAPCRRPWAPSTMPSPAAHASPAPDPLIRACSFHHLWCRVRSVCSEQIGKFTFSLVWKIRGTSTTMAMTTTTMTWATAMATATTIQTTIN